MEKLQCFFPHWVLRLKPEMILQNKIKTFCWLNTYKEWNVGRKFGFYLSSDFGTYEQISDVPIRDLSHAYESSWSEYRFE